MQHPYGELVSETGWEFQMTGLGDTVSNLLARGRALGEASAPIGQLTSVPNFGANPGGLRMWCHLPEALATKAALVVVLHGCGQTPSGYAAGSGWLELADRYDFALLCPEQLRANNANLCFNWFEDGDNRRNEGEAASIANMVKHALDVHHFDPSRVFVTGLSAGGAMTAVMLATYPEIFRGGAVVAGLPYGAASSVSQALAAMRHVAALSDRAWGDKVRSAAPRAPRWPTVAVWHGDADTTVNPAAADALVRQWCDVHGANLRLANPSATGGHSHTSWIASDGTVAVEHHRLADLGHGVPIRSDGEDACGFPAPWILEAGLSSSVQIARSWSLVGDRRHPSSGQRRETARHTNAGRLRPPGPKDVGETIAQALRDAGLLR